MNDWEELLDAMVAVGRKSTIPQPKFDTSKTESGVGTPANALTPEEYEKAWKEIVGDYPAFFEALEKFVPMTDENGAPRSAYDIFQDIAKHVYENPTVRCSDCIH